MYSNSCRTCDSPVPDTCLSICVITSMADITRDGGSISSRRASVFAGHLLAVVAAGGRWPLYAGLNGTGGGSISRRGMLFQRPPSTYVPHGGHPCFFSVN